MMTMMTSMCLLQKWVDEYLQWNKSEYNLDYIVVNAKDIWYPDLVIRNRFDDWPDAATDYISLLFRTS